MANLKIETINGNPRIFLNDTEIENVEVLNLDIDARRLPIATLRIHCTNIDIDTIIKEEAISLDRYEIKRIKPSIGTVFDKAYNKANKEE